MAKNKNIKHELTEYELQIKIDYLKKSKKKLRVFYGFAKLTKKIVRKKELAIYFENCITETNNRFVNQKIHIVYERFQTIEEMTDFDIGNRCFTKYGYFIDDKRWQGNIDSILEDNLLAEENHVCLKERNIIREKLRNEYFSFYGIEKREIGQQKLIFN